MPQPCAPTLCPSFLPQPYAKALCLSPMPQPNAPALCPSPMPQSYVPVLRPSLMFQPHAPALCPSPVVICENTICAKIYIYIYINNLKRNRALVTSGGPAGPNTQWKIYQACQVQSFVSADRSQGSAVCGAGALHWHILEFSCPPFAVPNLIWNH